MAGSIITNTQNDWENQTFISTRSGLYFDGSTTAANVQLLNTENSLNGFNFNSNFTFNCVFNIEDFLAVRHIFGNRSNSPTNEDGFGVRIFTDGRVQCDFVVGGTNNSTATSTGVVIAGRSYFLSVVRETNNILIYLNSELIIQESKSRVTVPTTHDILIGTRHNTAAGSPYYTNAWKGILSNISLFNTNLDRAEIIKLHTHQNYIEESLRQDSGLVYYLPLQEKKAHTLVAGDQALTDNAGLAIGNDIFHSVERQCNSEKTTALVNSHARAINFATNEIGTNSTEDASAIRNFFNSDIRKIFTGKKYNSSNSEYDIISSFSYYDYNQTLSIVIDILFSNTGSTQEIWGFGESSTVTPPQVGILGHRIRLRPSTNSIGIQFNNSTQGVLIDFDTSGLINGERYKFLFTKGSTCNTTGSFKCYANGQELSVSTNVGTNVTTTILPPSQLITRIGYRQIAAVQTHFLDQTLYNLEIINSEVTDQTEIEYISKWGTFEGLGKTYLLSVDFNKTKGELTDLSPSAYTITASPSAPTKLGNGTFIEQKTEMPYISECLRLQNTEYVEYPTTNLPDNTEDITLVVSGYMADITNSGGATEWEFLNFIGDKNNGTSFANCNACNRMFFAKRVVSVSYNAALNLSHRTGTATTVFNTEDNSFYFVQLATVLKPNEQVIEQYVNGNLVQRTTGVTTFNNYSTATSKLFRSGYLNFGEAAGVSSQSTEMYLSSFYYYKGRALDRWEIAELHKNTLQGSPFNWTTAQNTGFVDLLEMAYHFQEGNISWNGSAYVVENLAPNGSSGVATLGNYTTGSADFITDNPNSIGLMNSLR